MNWINFELDEIYPFRITSPNVKLSEGHCLEIPFHGTAQIKYRSTEDWWVENIITNGWNGKFGSKCETWEIDLERFPDLHKRISDYIVDFCCEDVEKAIDDDQRSQWEDQQFQAGKDRRLDAAE